MDYYGERRTRETENNNYTLDRSAALDCTKDVPEYIDTLTQVRQEEEGERARRMQGGDSAIGSFANAQLTAFMIKRLPIYDQQSESNPMYKEHLIISMHNDRSGEALAIAENPKHDSSSWLVRTMHSVVDRVSIPKASPSATPSTTPSGNTTGAMIAIVAKNDPEYQTARKFTREVEEKERERRLKGGPDILLAFHNAQVSALMIKRLPLYDQSSASNVLYKEHLNILLHQDRSGLAASCSENSRHQSWFAKTVLSVADLVHRGTAVAAAQ